MLTHNSKKKKSENQVKFLVEYPSDKVEEQYKEQESNKNIKVSIQRDIENKVSHNDADVKVMLEVTNPDDVYNPHAWEQIKKHLETEESQGNAESPFKAFSDQYGNEIIDFFDSKRENLLEIAKIDSQ